MHFTSHRIRYRVIVPLNASCLVHSLPSFLNIPSENVTTGENAKKGKGKRAPVVELEEEDDNNLWGAVSSGAALQDIIKVMALF